MDGVGTDEDKVWNTLTGLHADERAMVAQLYRIAYSVSLKAELNSEFSNNPIDGHELQKTLKIFHSGGLSLAEQIYYAVDGLGTDNVSLQAARCFANNQR